MPLLDRELERAEIDRVVGAVRVGLSGVLVLRGDAGIGKTALLDYAAEQADDLQVVRLCAIESEMELGFAALHQLLRPLLDLLGALPSPQRAALRSSFGLAADRVPDPFLVGLATLTLLAEAASRQPMLCLVDDAQWLDRESANALAFAARRLYADRIGIVFAVREPTDGRVTFDGLPELCVTGLPDAEAAQLVATTPFGRMDARVRARVVSEAAGNPLALVELAAELSPGQRSGGDLLPEPLPLSRRLESLFLRQVQLLPDATQTYLLVAAAEPTGDLALVRRAADSLGLDQDAPGPAEKQELLLPGARVAFRHPLIRSAIYYGAPVAERRRIHAALARASSSDLDAERRAWHRAEAASEPDEGVAADLEVVAELARARGGYAAVAAFLTRAAALTPDAHRRAQRLLAAAAAECTAGAPARAQTLLDDSRLLLSDAYERAQAQRLQAVIGYALGKATEDLPLLLEAAGALAPFDVHAARETLLDALTALRVGGGLAVREGMRAVADAVRSMPLPAGTEPTIGDLLVDGFAALSTDGPATAAPLFRAALAELGTADLEPEQALRWLVFGGWAAAALGDNDALHDLALRSVRSAREHGALVALTRGLHNLAISELVRGSIGAAEEYFDAGRDLVVAQANLIDLGEVIVLAWRGREAEARAAAEIAQRDARARGQGWIVTYVAYAMAVLELSVGNYEDALVHAQQADEDESYLLSSVLLPDLIEAAVRSGDGKVAYEALDRYSECAVVGGTSLALGMLARSRALLADDDDAEPLYVEAIGCLERCLATSHLARAHLVYGEWLRRQKRRRDAREQLRTAAETFDSIGADAFAERTRIELAATGETARSRSVETRNDLTPQEAQVARLAAAGATNSEIGSQLFISPSTVEYHLRKVFRKLDISSRRYLAAALAPTT